MFTVEIKVNGALIIHVYGHSLGDGTYHYEYYQTETQKVTSGEVAHQFSKGLAALVATIMADAEMKGASPPIRRT